MRLAGLIMWKVKADFRHLLAATKANVTIIVLALASAIPPAMASESSDTGRTKQVTNGRATAIASARIIGSFATRSTAQTAAGSKDLGITVSRRMSLCNCSTLLGADADPDAGENCALQLIELQ